MNLPAEEVDHPSSIGTVNARVIYRVRMNAWNRMRNVRGGLATCAELGGGAGAKARSGQGRKGNEGTDKDRVSRGLTRGHVL